MILPPALARFFRIASALASWSFLSRITCQLPPPPRDARTTSSPSRAGTDPRHSAQGLWRTTARKCDSASAGVNAAAVAVLAE